jgi:hypothetical protein
MRQKSEGNSTDWVYAAPPCQACKTSEVEAACDAFMEAHRAWVAMSEEADATLSLPDGASVVHARERRLAAFTTVRGLTARTGQEVRAKIEVLITLCEWCSCEDAVFLEFALEVVREADPFVAAHTVLDRESPDSGLVSTERRRQWLDRLP